MKTYQEATMVATYYFLTINAEGKVEIQYDGPTGGTVVRPVESMEDLGQFLWAQARAAGLDTPDDLTIMSSSALPREFTTDPVGVALSDAIRAYEYDREYVRVLDDMVADGYFEDLAARLVLLDEED